MSRARTVVAVVACGSVLALGACSGDDPEPRFAPTRSASAPSSPSTTAAAGVVAPTMPAEAQGSDAAAAEAFVRFYWEMADYAQMTGDVEGLRQLGTSACEACRTVVDYLTRVYRSGATIEGGSTSMSGAVTTEVRSGPRKAFAVAANVANTRQIVDHPGSKRDEEFPAATIKVQFIAEPGPTGWQVAFWETRS